MFSWVPYLLNQFLIDCRDAQDNGTEFHYSWMIILIALAGWKEPKFSSFLDRMGKCYAARYESLWQAKDNKTQQENNTVFAMLLEEIQQCTTNIWCIPVEVIQETEGIAKFKASRHHMWIQAARDPKKAWLEMQYCITKEEVDWIVKDWPAQWKMPVSKPVTRPITVQSSRPKDKAEAGSSVRKNNLTDNTRMTTTQNQPTGSSTVPK
jgi:hypothetical protein